MKKLNCEYLVFDFNGTLVDDIDICLFLLNKMLKEKGHNGNIDKDKYLSIFTFPIIEYYKEAGFEFPKDDFEGMAKVFDVDYRNYFSKLKLFDDVIEVLSYFKKNNKKLILLSATKQSNLEMETKEKKIYDFFDEIIGIKDVYGASKIDEAKNYFSSLDIDMDNVVFIGDTIHDYEVSSILKGNCILVSRGHQSEERLKTCKNAIISSTLKEIEDIII